MRLACPKYLTRISDRVNGPLHRSVLTDNMDDSSLSVLDAGLTALFRARCLAVASLTVTMYDWALTLDQEVRPYVAMFWMGYTLIFHRSNISGQGHGQCLEYYICVYVHDPH